jgi:hypothetical protein
MIYRILSKIRRVRIRLFQLREINIPNYFDTIPFCFKNIPLYFDDIPNYFSAIPLCFNKIPLYFKNIPFCFNDIPFCFENIPLCFDDIPLCFETIPLYFDDIPFCFTMIPKLFENIPLCFTKIPKPFTNIPPRRRRFLKIYTGNLHLFGINLKFFLRSRANVRLFIFVAPSYCVDNTAKRSRFQAKRLNFSIQPFDGN